MIQQIGKHRVRHGTVMDDGGLAMLMKGEGCDIFYSDPPWGEGNLKYWATMNKKMTGEVYQQPDLEAFLDQIFSIASEYAEGYVCIEYGCRWEDMIQSKGKNSGLTPLLIADVQYRGGRQGQMLPLHLHVFSKNGLTLPTNYSANLAGTSGWDCVAKAVGPLADIMKLKSDAPIILDPCCGMGYTAKAAMSFGLSFRGNELNSARLQKTINRLK